jgi:Fe-S oxidoreductase
MFGVIAKMTAKEGLKRNWGDLIKGDFKSTGEIVYFPGCFPMVAPLLDFEVGAEAISSGTVKILNQAGITPAIPEELGCCGHDAFWAGERAVFEELKEKNTKILKDAKIIITSCAEGYRTLKNDYSLNAEIYHITQFANKLMNEGKLKFNQTEKKITFQDPCRLGRHMGEYEAPRNVLKAIGDYKDMPRSGKDASCCGVGCWMNCNEYSKIIRVDRVKEAGEVADILITGCPKCLTHFRCTMAQPEKIEGLPQIEIRDFSEFVASNLKED